MATIAVTNKYRNFDLRLESLIRKYAATDFLVFTGRGLFALIFILSSFGHFTRATIDYAANQGVAYAEFFVPLSGIMALLGGLSILLGVQTRIGALLIIVFLIPVTLMMHNFWAISDPAQAEIQRIMFVKNVSMLGGALLLFYFGAGPMSFDNRSRP